MVHLVLLNLTGIGAPHDVIAGTRETSTCQRPVLEWPDGGFGDALAGLVWTIRGAPHVYRRADLQAVAAAAQPYSDADAGKRIFDASRPLKAAGISNLAALDAVAAALRSIVTTPMAKGGIRFRAV